MHSHYMPSRESQKRVATFKTSIFTEISGVPTVAGPNQVARPRHFANVVCFLGMHTERIQTPQYLRLLVQKTL